MKEIITDTWLIIRLSLIWLFFVGCLQPPSKPYYRISNVEFYFLTPTLKLNDCIEYEVTEDLNMSNNIIVVVSLGVEYYTDSITMENYAPESGLLGCKERIVEIELVREGEADANFIGWSDNLLKKIRIKNVDKINLPKTFADCNHLYTLGIRDTSFFKLTHPILNSRLGFNAIERDRNAIIFLAEVKFNNIKIHESHECILRIKLSNDRVIWNKRRINLNAE